MNQPIITTKEAAERLGVTQRRINALIESGKLPAKLFGNSWMINEEDLALVAERKPGRPPKIEGEQAATAQAHAPPVDKPVEKTAEKPAKKRTGKKATRRSAKK
jgi:excisionase family DNA binding protein